jgi:iron complex outermembrane receptor protein
MRPRSVRKGANRKQRGSTAACAFGLTCLIGVDAASAQAPSAPAGSETLEAIVVTATKRRENIQDMPASAWVATDTDLTDSIARDFDDLARLAPSFTITKTSQPANNSINIRGVGTYAFSIATKPSVSVVVDDVPQAFQAQAFQALGDAAQVEIMRGPQSTLFGTSASAGVINITTHAPGSLFESGVKAMATSDGEQRVGGFLSGPVTGQIKARLSAGSVFYRGNLYNIYTRNWVNGHDDLFARATLLWEPTADWRITLASHWNDTDGSCCTSASYALSPGVTFGRFRGYQAAQAAVLGSVAPGQDNRRISADLDPRADAVDRGGSLKVERRLGDLTLLSVSAFNRYDLQDTQDTDGSSFNWGPGGAAIPGAMEGGSANGGKFQVSSLSSELRLISPTEQRLRYIAALFFSRTNSARSFVRGSNSLTQYGTLNVVPPTTSAYSSYLTRARSENYALFGTATFDATRRLGIVTGLRFNREQLGYSFFDHFNQVSFGSPRCATTTPSGLAASTCDAFDSVTGKFALTYRVVPSMLLFAGYDRGYKGAAYDLTSTYTTRSPVTTPGPDQGRPIADVVASQQPVAAETVDAFQLGAKGALHERLTWSVTLFDERFHNFQAQSRDELTQQNLLNSVERVTTRGVELELAASLPHALRLNASGAYDEATTRRFTNAACFASQTPALGCIGGKQDLSGKPMSNAPRWKLGLGAGIDIPLAGGQLVADAGYHWQSAIMHSLLRDPNSLQKAYGVLDLSLGVEGKSWTVKAFVVNALDQNYSLTKARDGNWNINPYGASTGPITDATRWAPARDSARYFGMELSLRH